MISIGAAAQTVYKDTIGGSVHNTHFNFTHGSDWKNHQIVNFIRNDHSEGLIVFWKEGGVTRPVENPLAPGDTDSNKSYCPENRLSSDLSATLSYGLSDNKKTAGVYTIAQTTNTRATLQMPSPQENPAQPEQMVSEISTSIKGEPVKFRVVSERRDEFVEYYFEFLQGKPVSFAVNIQPRLFKYFAEVGVQPKSGASEVLKYEKLPLREQVDDFKAYSLFKPVYPKSFVKIPAKAVQIRRQLLFLVDQDMRVLASGFVTLHVPAE
jgi:hypothetical protein